MLIELALVALSGALLLRCARQALRAAWVVPLSVLAVWLCAAQPTLVMSAGLCCWGTLALLQLCSAGQQSTEDIAAYLRLLGATEATAVRGANCCRWQSGAALAVLGTLLSALLVAFEADAVLSWAWVPAAALLLCAHWPRRSAALARPDNSFRLPRPAQESSGPLAFGERPADGSEELFPR